MNVNFVTMDGCMLFEYTPANDVIGKEEELQPPNSLSLSLSLSLSHTHTQTHTHTHTHTQTHVYKRHF